MINSAGKEIESISKLSFDPIVMEGGQMSKKKERRYWLMKSEPKAFSFEDLKSAEFRTTAWDGVRNYQARNLLRDEIKPGDGVLFYHSNIEKPAIVGLAKVTREGYPDTTAMDPGSDHYDSRASETEPIWYMVDIAYLADLPEPLTRDALKKHPILSRMGVLQKGNRLSVQPVTREEWKAVIDVSAMADPLEK